MFFFPSATSFRNDIAQPSLNCPQISQIHADFQKTPHSGVATGFGNPKTAAKANQRSK